MSPYRDLAGRCARLDQRHLRYRFDLERDVCWDRLSEEGLLFGPSYLEALGLSAELGSNETFQGALALATCEVFHELEALICRFSRDEAEALGPTRSVTLLCEEEEKHMELFRRFADGLRAERPALAAECQEKFQDAFAPSAGLLSHLHEDERFSPAAFHYLFWINTLFFEELTVWLDDRLADDGERIQPTWRAVHRVHRQEEVQHIVTDAAHLEALDLDVAERRELSKIFLLRLEEGFDRFFGVEAALEMAGVQSPEDRTFRQLPLCEALCRDPAFRRTRAAAPALAALAASLGEAEEPAAAAEAPALLEGAPLVGLDEGPRSLAQVLNRAASRKVPLTYVSGRGEVRRETAADLRKRGARIGSGLAALGAVRGDPVVLLLPDPQEFVSAFWACLLEGLVPVPLGLSLRRRLRADRARVERVLGRLGDPLLVVDASLGGLLPSSWRTHTTAELLADPGLLPPASGVGRIGASEEARTERVGPALSEEPDLQQGAGSESADDSGPIEIPAPEPPSVPEGPEPGWIQFSSGSTGEPRGIVLHARQILANTLSAQQHLEVTAQDVVVSWMPLHHDMGLAYHLTALASAAPQVLLSPLRFARAPRSWLEALHRFRGTVSAAPNFGYAQVLRRLERQGPEGLDLSCVRVLLDGAEPISVEVARRFTQALASTGLPADALRPAYGLAEATCAVTIASGRRPLREHALVRESLDAPGGVRKTSPEDEAAARFAGCGGPVPGVAIRIRSASGALAPAGVVGEVEVAGPNLCAGFLEDAAASAERLVPDGDRVWLRTGDQGLILDEELVITGRAADRIFVGGRNLFASDLEHLLRKVPGLRSDRVAVIGVTDPARGVERVIPCVRPLRGGAGREAVVSEVVSRLSEAIGYPVDEVLVLPADRFPRTTSGKIQRHALRVAYAAGELAAFAHRRGRRGESGRLARAAATAWQEASERSEVSTEGPALPGGPPGDLIAAWSERIRVLWAEALERPLDEVGPSQSFFALGGDSLLAVEVHGQLEVLAGRDLDVALLRECRTVAETARAMAETVGEPPSEAAPDPARDLASSQASGRAARPVWAGDEVAVVGMACRFPGAPDLTTFWELLRGGGVATGPVARERWDAARFYDPDPRAPGKTVCTQGGFLDDVRGFDAGAFGIDPDEARQIDPQQRLFLEVAAEALSSAGTRSRSVGVFAGAGGNEYFQAQSSDPYRITAASAPANLDNMLAARVSQRLGLTGPALTVNAACATSLVSVLLAARSVLAGECELAIAGGAQLNLSVTPFLLFSQAGVLSPSGRCRPFSSQRDGFVPGEGAGAVVLKPLAAAQRDGDTILGVIRGGAMNNDGGGLSSMAPNPAGQRAVLRQAWEQAGLDPQTASYVEAHGTATAVGDPVEVRALREVFGPAGARDLGLGSVKANLGHLLNAAGIASLIKVLLALHHELLPPTPGCDEGPVGEADRDLDLGRGEEEGQAVLCPLATARPWPRGEAPRRAGVSAFGIGGTNCHLVIEEAPAPPEEATPRQERLLCLSAPDGAGLERQAQAYARALDAGALSLDALCAALRGPALRFPRRQALTVSSPAEASAELGSLRAETDESSGPSLRRRRSSPRLVFLFPGPGSQYPGMGSHLWQEAAFAAAWAECELALAPHLELPLHELLGEVPAEGQRPSVDRIEHAQPVVFALSYALARWLADLGVEPDAVLGHSAGEYAGAVVAGVLSLEDAARLVVRRGELMAKAPPGRMAAVFAGESQVRAALAEVQGAVSVAALNEPDQTVVSGASEDLDQLLAHLREGGVESRLLAVGCAAHSPLMSAAAVAFREDLALVSPQAPRLPLYSTQIGARVAALPRAYWSDHLRAPVRFERAVRAALAEGQRTFVELSGSGALSHCVLQIAHAVSPTLAEEVRVFPLIRRSEAGWRATLEALGGLFEAGVDLDLGRLERASRPAFLPPYPYERRELWLEAPRLEVSGSAPRAALRFALEDSPTVRDHRVHGTPIAPAALLFDRVLQACAPTNVPASLEEVVIGRPLALEPGVPRVGRLRESEEGLVLETRPEASRDDSEWVAHLSARFVPLRRAADRAPRPEDSLAAARERCPREREPAEIYAQLAAGGLAYGPSVQTLRALWRGKGELVAELDLAAPTSDAPEVDEDLPQSFSADPFQAGAQHRLHPGLVDGAMQAIAGLTLDVDLEGAPTFLGFAVHRLTVLAPVSGRCFAHVRLASELTPRAETIRCDTTLFGPQGGVLARFEGVALKRFRGRDQAALLGEARLFAPVWREAPPLLARPRLPATAGVVVWGRSGALKTALEREVESAGAVALPAGGAPQGALPFLQQADQRAAILLEPSPSEFAEFAESLARAELEALGGLVVCSNSAEVLGFARALDRERPGWGCRIVQHAEVEPAALAKALVAELADAAGPLVVKRSAAEAAEEEGEESGEGALPAESVARRRAVLARRTLDLEPRDAPVGEAREALLRPRGVYWITGGLGGLGRTFAEVLARRVGARLLLTGRRPRADRAFLELLDAAGGEARYVPADATDRDSLVRALAVAREAWGELHGVIHAAGVLADAPLGQRTPEQAHAVRAAKVRGAEHLAAVTEGEDLDFFVLTSSLSGWLGVPGQTDYGAANAALDAFAERLERGRTRVLSVAWGPWRDVGMVRDDRYQRRFRAMGLRPLAPVSGGEALLAALATPEARSLAALDLDPGREGALRAAFRRPSGRGGIPEEVRPSAVSDDAPLRDFVRARLAQHLRCGPGDVDPRAPFQSLGVDSLMAVTLVRELERRLERRLYPTLLFEFQTVDALVRHLEASQPEPAPAPSEPVAPATPADPESTTWAWEARDGGLARVALTRRDPAPGALEIEVQAAGVNFIDLLAQAGAHPLHGSRPTLLGHEVAGEVSAVGADVVGFAVGDRVAALVGAGGCATHVEVPAASVYRLPDDVSWEEGAALLISGLTAIACVELKGRLREGERVLVQAAAGATGLACARLALHHGAEVFGTASAPEKLERLAELGIDHPIDYSVEPFDLAIRRILDGPSLEDEASGEGLDLVIDSLSGDAIPRGLALLRPGGRFVEIGAAGIVATPVVDPRQLFSDDLDFATVNVARLGADPARLTRALERLGELVTAGVLRADVGHRLSLEEAPRALALLRERRNLGKVVLIREVPGEQS
jgi:myxalamid-type polyketide synthase MxaD